MNKKASMAQLCPLMEETLRSGGEVIFTITGNSMYPMLHHKMDRVRLVAAENGQLKKYDIPLFRRANGSYILHRVVSVQQGGYTVVGDNQWVREPSVRPNQIIGVVNGFWRNGVYVSCDNFFYRCYCVVWTFLLPCRRFLLVGRQKLCAVAHVVRKGK